MLVKLSGDKYINSEHITGIERYVGSGEWAVRTVDKHCWDLTQQQFDELMDCLPAPVESVKKLQSQLNDKGA